MKQLWKWMWHMHLAECHFRVNQTQAHAGWFQDTKGTGKDYPVSLTTAFTRPPSKRLEISHYRSLNALSHCFPHKLCALAVSISQCAAAAKSLQSCPTLCDSIDGSPPGSAVPGILQARTHMWVAISFSNALKWKVKVKSLSRARLLATPWPMGFSRQEYWRGVPLPSPISQCSMPLILLKGGWGGG